MKAIDIALLTYLHKKKYFENYLEIAKQIKEFISKNYDENVRVLVFGSVPKGTYTPLSDLDILIISDKIKEYAKAVVEIKDHLNDFFAPIEFHFATNETFNRWYKRFLDYYIEI
jgi:predicted nucleotidyltransferase